MSTLHDVLSLRPPRGGVNGVPLQQLFGSERVHLEAGASQLVNLCPEMHDFSHVYNRANGMT